MGPIGYLVYVAFVFLPGIGLGELLGLWGGYSSLTARIAYSFGLGLCVDTFVLVVRTSGLIPSLAGIDAWTIYGAIVFGLGCLSLSIALHKKFAFWVAPKKLDFAVLGAMAVQGLMVLLYFQKYPIFPEYQTPDYAIHVMDAQSLLSGSLTTIPAGILYFGVHLQIASSLLLVGGVPLVTARWTMALLAVASPLLFYLAAQRLFGNALVATIAAVVYSLSGTIWFGSVFDSGLYANFFGILITLFLVVAFLDSSTDGGSFGVWVVLFLAVAAAYFSHYTFLTVLPALLLFGLAQFAVKRKLPRRTVMSVLVVTLPGVVGVLLYPNFSTLLSSVNSTGGIITGGTLLSSALSGFPVLSYMALETYDDLAFVTVVFLAAVCVWQTIKMKSPLLALPLAWTVALLVASPYNTSAWRYSFEALVPFTLMTAFGLFTLLPKLEFKKGMRPTKSAQRKAVAIIALVLLPILVGSWGTTMVSDATSGTAVFSQVQVLVNQSISWLQVNTPHNSSYLSVSDWRFTYTSLFIERPTTYMYSNDPNQAQSYAQANGLAYIIVTNLVTAEVSSSAGELPWNTFPANSTSSLTLVYTNADVRIYQIA